ncbi:WecB/TagA/CpsF family glycosyltransferase [Bombilactobacillus thymidiniphilus]|uniref:N-acetylglucosaminyldiphosphoundecaprenol N-acetyl-beta-D-mannosaminyltransferase n=1 Tax=Bombilactobacillus thymidiniphilus TaxID=2923363 RepID=A0ABY4PBT2_9LACO|nr:WecB/TagA/CpsF family glycosyltransferase [Bombilactobacillus thymidiniphilus]UQS83223.1 WecB/TagA/CpsF family glycosyltransferase [Bombilactobacillus thymidiniphilus]
MNQKITILDLPFINTTQEKFNQELVKRLQKKLNTFIVTANPEIAVYAHDNPAYKQLIQQADYITPDGIGIVKASQMLNKPLTERITGFDTLTSLLEIANNHSLKIYLLGAKPEIIQQTVQNIQQKYTNLQLVGYNDGYFTDKQPIVADIKEKQPNIVAVALGYPKQEEFIARNRNISDAVWIGVGGSFDVLSGKVKRAPKIFQDLHLEWFYRFATHPTRLKRIKVLPRFIKLVKKEQH